MTRMAWRLGFLLLPAALAGCLTDGPNAASPDFQAVTHPEPPVVFLHYDYMVGADGHSHVPQPEAIAMVVEAFRNAGLRLQLDPRHAAIPEGPTQILDFDLPCGGEDFQTLKARYFHPAGVQPWHYAILGHWGRASCEYFSGYADLPGFDFMVTIGTTVRLEADGQRFCLWDSVEACQREEAGYLMHELGHNLDLHHGGDSDEIYKPNYLSVMNYLWLNGVASSSAPGETGPPYRIRIDYSGLALPTLNEQHLDERVGLGGPADDRDVSLYLSYACDDPLPWYGCAPAGDVVIASTGPVDWNQNGIIESDVRYDVNFTQVWMFAQWYPLLPDYSIHHGFDDWAHVQEFLRTPAYVTGKIKTLRHEP